MTKGRVVRAHVRAGVGRLALAAIAVAAFASIAAAPASATPRLSVRAQGHYYRQGVVPRLVHGPGGSVPTNNPIPGELSYQGGSFGPPAMGVTTGKPRVYLVFWGSQWGTASTNSNGYATYSGDPKGMAPDLQAFFAGLGTNSETWSGVATQYCEGVAAGTQTCPNSAPHVGYPTGGALAAVWEDTASAAPAQATQAQLAGEAWRAAGHFGNNTQALNRNVQYFIVSPTGTHPDGFNTASGNFCAWHFSAGPSTDKVAYTNMPYVTDAGASCGQNFVNSGSSGTLDGVTIVGGHEYAETITDQFPSGGWLDSAGNESADKCAWVNTGTGKSQNLTLATGTFAVQGIWANDANNNTGGCEVSHPIFGQTGNTVTVTSPGNQSTQTGTAVSLQIQASDSGSSTLTYSATGLPAGLSINSSTGLITGTPTTAGTSSVQVTATDTTSASGSATFSWTITAPNTVTVTNPGNQTTTAGTAVSLQIQASDSGGSTLSYSATGLPAGLQINASSGLITGTPTTTGTSSVTVTATDTTGAFGNASFSWTISSASTCTAKQLIGNPGFETGSTSPWGLSPGSIQASSVSEPSHSGNYDANFGRTTAANVVLAQPVQVPSGCANYQFSFWAHVDSTENTAQAYDTLTVQLVINNTTTLTEATLTNLNAATGYQQYTFSVPSMAGAKVLVRFLASNTDAGGGSTNFVVDDTALNVS